MGSKQTGRERRQKREGEIGPGFEPKVEDYSFGSFQKPSKPRPAQESFKLVKDVQKLKPVEEKALAERILVKHFKRMREEMIKEEMEALEQLLRRKPNMTKEERKCIIEEFQTELQKILGDRSRSHAQDSPDKQCITGCAR
jgi:hypothetical protein